MVDERQAQATILQLVGVVCYYGKHYSTFFFHSKMKKWISFDDATVREVRNVKPILYEFSLRVLYVSETIPAVVIVFVCVYME